MHVAVMMSLFLSLAEAKYYKPFQVHQYEAGPSVHSEQGKPTSRHKNHCAYVTERTVSFTLQDGAAPYVKAEYNKCSWSKKCPSLLYRLMYKPLFKVAHKTVTELEWRCCPGFSGLDCMEGHPIYQHPMRMMPPFKGPPRKGPPSKGPMFKGPSVNMQVKANPWNQPNGPPNSGFNSYPVPHFGPQGSPSYGDISFDPYPPESEYQEPHLTDTDQGGEQRRGLDGFISEKIPAPPTEEEQPEEETAGHAINPETEERIYGMEEEVRRLSQGLETLKGTLKGLEDSLRASLREDANRMLSALLSVSPSPLSAPATAANPSTVGFVEIPAGDPDREGLDGSHVFPGFMDLNVRIEELSSELLELKAAVTQHDSALRKITNGAGEASDSTSDFQSLIDAKLSAVRVEILNGFEKRVKSAESRCDEKTGDELHHCQKENHQQQEHMTEALKLSTLKLRSEIGKLQTQIHGMPDTESCCARIPGMEEIVRQLETSMESLNRSQGDLRVELGGHKDHIEGILEGRLSYVEAKLNLTKFIKGDVSGRRKTELGHVFKTRGFDEPMDEPLKALEGRILASLEELGNTSVPTVLEGHAVTSLETGLESLRGRLKLDVDDVQKRLSNLETLCSSSCSSAPQRDSAGPSKNQEMEQKVKEVLSSQGDHLDALNGTLQNILKGLTPMENQDQVGEITALKLKVHSVNRTLLSLQESLDTALARVGEANSSWHDRELRLAQQIKGVVQLVGHHASMLGTGERRLSRLKGELLELKRRLTEEVRGCRSTAMVVKKEVTEVGGRVATVEDQCKGLRDLAEDVERMRDQLEKQSNAFVPQVNGTVSGHTQLDGPKQELTNCSAPIEPTPSSDMKENVKRGDTFTLL